MWSWLSKIDPNTVLLGVSLIGSVVTWAYHSIRGDEKESAGDLAEGTARQLAQVAVDMYGKLPPQQAQLQIAGWMTDKLWGELGKAGIQRNPALDLIVRAAAAHGVADAMELIQKFAAPPTPQAIPITSGGSK